MCKAKMLLTVLNKRLNHLCQTEGLEKRERQRRAGSDFPCRQNAIIRALFFKVKTLNPSHLPGDARGLFLFAICNFKYVFMNVYVRMCDCVICIQDSWRKRSIERDGSKGPLRRGRWGTKYAIIFSASF